MTPRERWAAALRSGNYEQATGQLRRTSGERRGYCCLGVACDLYREDHPEAKWVGIYRETFSLPGTVGAEGALNESTLFLPQDVQDWLGVTNHATQERLSEMNDDGASFDEIADEIDALAREERF